MRRALIAALAALLTVGCAGKAWKPVVIYGGSAAADFGATAAAERHGDQWESNPALQGETSRYVIGAASVAGATAIDVWLQKKDLGEWAWVLRAVSVLAHGYGTYTAVKAMREDGR